MTKKHFLLAMGFIVAAFALSVGLSLVITSAMSGRDHPSPAAGLAWILLSCVLFIVFAFLGLIYLIEFFHTRAQGGDKVLWRNFTLRLLLSLTGLIGPFWMLGVHPTLAQKPALLQAINILVAALSILLLLWAFSRRFPVPNHESSAAAVATEQASDEPGQKDS